MGKSTAAFGIPSETTASRLRRSFLFEGGGDGGSVVVPSAHHLLAGGPQQDGVLELGGVAALGVAERRVRVHDAQVAQVLQRHQVLALAEAVQPAAAERQRAEVLVHHVQQVLRSGEPAGEGGGVNFLPPFLSFSM